MAVKKVIHLDVNTEEGVKDVKKLTGEIHKTDKQTDALKDTTNSLTDKLDRMTGGAISGFRNMVGGVKKGITAMKTLKVAIAATGIGLLVVAIGTLVTYFTKTQRGADFVSKAFAGLKATVDVLIDRVSAFGEGLFMIMNGEFEAGAKKLAASIKDVGKEIKAEAKEAYELEEALHAVEDREISLIKVNAKKRAEIEKLRLEAEELARTDKKAAAEKLKRAIALEDEIFQNDLEIAKERARISKAQLKQGESSREEIRADAELQVRVIELQGEKARRLKTVQTRLNSLLGVEKEITEEIQKRNNIESIDGGVETGKVNAEVAIEDAINQGKLESLEAYTAKRKQIADNAAKAEIEIERIKKEALINVAGQTFGAIADIVGRNSKVGKAAGIAQALINTYQGITEVWKSESILPEPAATIARIASTATVAASGFAAVKNIAAVKIPGGGGGSGGSATPAKATPPPSPSFNIVGNSQANQLAGALNRDQQPVQAYVVSREMSSQQEMDRNIRQTASVG